MRVDSLASAEPKKLVPGEPGLVWEMAGDLGGVGVAFEEIGLGFRDIDDGGWCGGAADAFRGLFERQPRRFLEAADAFVGAAGALDTYASALSWAQRQAGEAIALVREVQSAVAEASSGSLSFAQQAEQNGVLVGGGVAAAPVQSREMRYAAAADTLRRALDQLRQVGDEAAVKVRAASGLAPRGTALWEAVFSPSTGGGVKRSRSGVVLVRSFASKDVGALAGAQHPDLIFKRRLDHEALRDSPWSWEAGVADLRKRLRRLALDQLSPRLAQHLFVGHVKKRKNGAGYRELGYHHREGGVDRGAVRVVRVVAPPDDDGVYRARVAGPRTEGGSELRTSTFFPDSWGRKDVLRAILLAFLNRTYYDDRDPAVRRKWRGRGRGLLIEGYVETQVIEPSVSARSARPYHIVTAYPVYRGGSGCGQGD